MAINITPMVNYWSSKECNLGNWIKLVLEATETQSHMQNMLHKLTKTLQTSEERARYRTCFHFHVYIFM